MSRQNASTKITAALSIDLGSRESLSVQLTRALRAAIVTLRILPGEMLSEQDIATSLRVSRHPVREALFKLREAGLIRVLPQRGTLVLKISRSAVEDARFIRESLERSVAQEAARLITTPGTAELRSNLSRLRRAAKQQDAEAFFALDDEFHRLLAKVAKRMAVWEFLADVKPQMDRVRYLSMGAPMPRETIVAHHTAIFEAVAAGDEAAADQAMQTHLSAIIYSLPRLAASHPDLFELEDLEAGPRDMSLSTDRAGALARQRPGR